MRPARVRDAVAVLWSRTSDRSSSRRLRAALGVVVLVVALAAVAYVATRDTSDDRARDEVVASVRELVTAAAVVPDLRGPRLCDRLTAGTRERLDALLELSSTSEARRGCSVAVAEVPWRLRPITADRDRTDADTWDVRIDGDRAVVDRGGEGVLRLARIAGRWQADLEADPAWAHRLVVAEACTRAGRSAAGVVPPRGTVSSLRAYFARNARILEILARRVGRETPPRGLAATDRRLVEATTVAARRFRTAAARVSADPDRLTSVLRRVSPDGYDLVAQLPATVSLRFRRAVGFCFTDTAVIADPKGAARLDRICARAARPLAELGPIRSLADLRAYASAVRAALRPLPGGLNRVLLPRGQEPVREAVLARIRTMSRDATGFAAALRAGGLPSRALAERVELTGVAIDLGLRQLGVRCLVGDGAGAARGTPI